MTNTLSVRLDEARRKKLEAVIAQRGVGVTELVHEWVDSLETKELTWDEILAPVRAAAAKIKREDRRPNPVLAERKKRKFNERLRGHLNPVRPVPSR